MAGEEGGRRPLLGDRIGLQAGEVLSEQVFSDDLKPGVRYIAEIMDCCVGGQVDLGEFSYQSGEGWLYFELASFYEWNGVAFREEPA